MNFHIITIFPDLIREYLAIGVLSRAIKAGGIGVEVYDLRDYSINRYNKIDKPVYGHGKGMLFEPEPLKKVIETVKKKNPNARTVFLTPQGKKLDNKLAREFSSEEDLVLIAARYEGIDTRIIESMVDDEISVGDYVLTGGELPALTLMDTVSRFTGGTVKSGSLEDESFEEGLLEYRHYTEPIVFEGMEVPSVLRSGNHEEINRFRFQSAIKTTYKNRIDLLRDYKLPELKIETKNEIKRLKKENNRLKEYLKLIQKTNEEWRDGRRNGKERSQ